MPTAAVVETDYDLKYAFHVVCAKLAGRMTFKTCSEISAEVALVEHREGGSLIARKSAGLATFPPVTLTNGVISKQPGQDQSMYAWFLEMCSATVQDPNGAGARGFGIAGDAYKQDLVIVQKDRDGLPIKSIRLKNAWVGKYVVGDWDNTANEMTLQSIEIHYDWFEILVGRQAVSAAATQTVEVP